MNGYNVPRAAARFEEIIQKSRFIGRLWPVSTETEALNILRSVRETERDATHHVFAYRLRGEGIMRHSDDGEPSGTAGLPLLETFLRRDVYDFLCVSTRYFGGILLGAGGLVRAYARSGAGALDAAGVAVMRLWSDGRLRCPYALLDRIRLLLDERGAVVADVEYAEDALVRFALPAEAWESFAPALAELSAGRLAPELLTTAYRAM